MQKAQYELVVVGAGIAGMSVAVEAASLGVRTLLIERQKSVGGVLEVSSGQMSAGGTQLQAARSIADSPEEHLDDIYRISKNKGFVKDLVVQAVREAPASIDWLMENGFDMAEECPALYHFHEAYSKPRTYWGKEGGASLIKFFSQQIRRTQLAGNLFVRLGTEMKDFSKTRQGKILLTLFDGETILAQNMVLAAGGYLGNTKLIQRFTTTKKILSAGWVHSDGKVLELLADKGYLFHGLNEFVPTFGGIEEVSGSRVAERSRIPAFVPQTRQPWEVYVNVEGKRFLCEDSLSVDYREKALRNLDQMGFWVVFDANIFGRAPDLLPSWSQDEIEQAWNNHPSFVRAEGLEIFAQQTGMPLETLGQTLEAYNASVLAGEDQDGFGRTHMPAPIRGPIYYGIFNNASLVKSFAGVKVDHDLRILDEEANPEPNVFAVGEILGGYAMSGDAFLGGMSLTPAISLGRLLARRIANEAS